MKSLVGTLLNKTPVPYTGRLSISMPWSHRTGAEAHMKAMGSVGTLFAIVNRNSTAVAQANWRLWRKAKSGKDEDRIEVTRHAALNLWNKPNPFMTRQEFVETFQQHLDLTGEGWWLAGRDPRVTFPTELWPVRPDRMEPVPHPTDFLAGYIYHGPDGQKVPLDLDEVIQLRMPNPLDPYRGLGPVQSLLVDLDSTRYSAEWNRSFFLNSAEPGGIVQLDKRLEDDEFDEMRERWREQHQGIAQAHRVAILENGAKWVDRKFTMRDMQFAELRNQSRELIREAFGFPKPLLGTVDDVNRANSEAAEVMFARWLVNPPLERIKQALNSNLLPMFGATSEGLEFDYDDPTPDDVEMDTKVLTARSNAAKVLRDAGWDADDVLSAVGLPEMRYVSAPAPAPVIAPGGAE